MNELAPGRPSAYTETLAGTICERIATSRLGLEEVLMELEPNAPSQSMVYRWLEAHQPFRERYSRARDFQADYMADLIAKEAFTIRLGITRKETARGLEVIESDNVERSRLIVSALLKRAAQLAPKKYADHLKVEHTGTPVNELSDADLEARIAALQEHRQD